MPHRFPEGKPALFSEGNQGILPPGTQFDLFRRTAEMKQDVEDMYPTTMTHTIKVKEEEDAIIDRKLHGHLKRRRKKKRSKQDRCIDDVSIDQNVEDTLENLVKANNKLSGHLQTNKCLESQGHALNASSAQKAIDIIKAHPNLMQVFQQAAASETSGNSVN